MPLTPITQDWTMIQNRFIDYRSPVASDNHNKILKSMMKLGEHRMWCSGFDLADNKAYLEADHDNQVMNLRIGPGVCIVNFMVIEFLQEVCIHLFEAPVLEPTWKYVVVEYKYRKTEPNSFAVIKSVDVVDDTCQIVLYRFRVLGWDILPNEDEVDDPEDWRWKWIADWAYKTFVLKIGDNMTGELYTPGLRTNSITAIGSTELFHSNDPTNNGLITPLGIMDDKGVVLTNVNESRFGASAFTSPDGKHSIKFKPPLAGDVDTEAAFISFNINNTMVSHVNALGTWGVVSADVAELFEHNLTEEPQQGLCLVFDDEGKAVLADKDTPKTIIGVVSYKPGLLLGVSGEINYKRLFKKGLVPIALVGQIDDVEVFSEEDRPAGTYLIPYHKGILKSLPKDNIDANDLLNIVGKTMRPIKKGINKIKILVNIR
jgi:hypothetical protein